jgi:hypothetical protein
MTDELNRPLLGTALLALFVVVTAPTVQALPDPHNEVAPVHPLPNMQTAGGVFDFAGWIAGMAVDSVFGIVKQAGGGEDGLCPTDGVCTQGDGGDGGNGGNGGNGGDGCSGSGLQITLTHNGCKGGKGGPGANGGYGGRGGSGESCFEGVACSPGNPGNPGHRGSDGKNGTNGGWEIVPVVVDHALRTKG